MENTRPCDYCRTPFTPRLPTQRFCSPKCRVYAFRRDGRADTASVTPSVTSEDSEALQALRARVAELEAALAGTAPGRSQRGTRAQAAELDEWMAAEIRRGVREALASRDAADTLAIEQANEVLSRATGRDRPPFNPQQYHIVLWALHPDNKDEQKTAEAFILVRQRKHILCDAGPIQRRGKGVEPLPKTVDEMLARRRTKQRK